LRGKVTHLPLLPTLEWSSPYRPCPRYFFFAWFREVAAYFVFLDLPWRVILGLPGMKLVPEIPILLRVAIFLRCGPTNYSRFAL
jgi:hypothetical protein